MFSRENGSKASIGDYDHILINLLDLGKKMHPWFFTTGVFIGNFSLRRSLRSGATTEAENKNVDTADIELINRCRKRGRSRSIDATGVHTGVQSRCGLSTLLSESLGKPRALKACSAKKRENLLVETEIICHFRDLILCNVKRLQFH